MQKKCSIPGDGYCRVKAVFDLAGKPSSRNSGMSTRRQKCCPLSAASLGTDFTEREYASALIHGRSFHLPYYHPHTHSIPVASIQFRSHFPRLLDLFTHFASHAASSLAIPVSRVVMLPTQRVDVDCASESCLRTKSRRKNLNAKCTNE